MVVLIRFFVNPQCGLGRIKQRFTLTVFVYLVPCYWLIYWFTSLLPSWVSHQSCWESDLEWWLDNRAVSVYVHTSQVNVVMHQNSHFYRAHSSCSEGAWIIFPLSWSKKATKVSVKRAGESEAVLKMGCLYLSRAVTDHSTVLMGVGGYWEPASCQPKLICCDIRRVFQFGTRA